MQILKQSLFEKILVIIIKTGLYASLLMPFVVTNFTLYPYVFGRAMFFQIIVELILPFWALLVALYPAYRPSFRRNFKSAGVLNTLIGVWALALIITTITSANPARSFWGSQERMMGVFTILHFIAFYYIFASVLRSAKEFAHFLWGVCAIGAVVIAQSIYESIGAWGERAQGMFGNPGILGSFLLFFIFFIPLTAIITDELKFLRRRYIIAAALVLEFSALAAVLFNQTRAVWIGLFVSFLTGIWFIPARLTRFKRSGFIAAGIFCVGVGIFAGAVFADRMPDRVYAAVPFLERVRGLRDQSRLFVWNTALQSFQDRPIFGYGLGNFSIPFNKRYEPEVAAFTASYIGPRLTFDQAHNQPLEYLSTTGIIGFGAYMALLFGVIAFLLKGRKKAANVVAALLLIAYSAHLFFTFDTPSSSLLFIVTLGAAYHLLLATDARQQILKKEKSSVQSSAFPVILGIIAFPFILLLFILNGKSLFASHNATIAFAAIQSKADMQMQWHFFKKALEYRSPYSFDIAEEIGDDFLTSIDETANLDEIAPTLIGELKKQSANEWHRLLLIGRLQTIACQKQKEAGYCKRSLEYLERAKALAPQRFQIYTEEYVAYTLLQEYEKAKDAVERAIELGYTPTALPVLVNLGFIYGYTGEYQQSLWYYEKALALDPQNSELLSQKESIENLLKEKE